MIWCSPKITSLLIHAAITDPQWITTDHLSVFCDISTTSFAHRTPLHILKKWKTKQFAYITNNLPEEVWEKYQEQIDTQCNNTSISSNECINSHWQKLKTIILNAANSSLKKKQLNCTPSPPKQFVNINKKLKIII